MMIRHKIKLGKLSVSNACINNFQRWRYYACFSSVDSDCTKVNCLKPTSIVIFLYVLNQSFLHYLSNKKNFCQLTFKNFESSSRPSNFFSREKKPEEERLFVLLFSFCKFYRLRKKFIVYTGTPKSFFKKKNSVS